MFPFFIISENCVLYSPFQETRENSIVVVNRLHILYIKKDMCIISLHIVRKKIAINAKKSAIVRNNPILSANTDIISSATLPP